MHHTFYVNNKTSCGRIIDPSKKNGGVFSQSNTLRATGLDSLVTCSDCQMELRNYRKHFPLASNRTIPMQVGDRIVFVPEPMGGAR